MVRGKACDVHELSWISPGCIQCCGFLYGGGQDDATQSGISSFGSSDLLNQLSREV